MTSLISAEHVYKSYDNGSITALRDVSLAVSHNEFVVIAGPSGSGKSTLMHMLCGLDSPTSGRILFNGRVPSGKKEWTRLRAGHIGFVFQSFNLLPTLTAGENIEAAMFGMVREQRDRHDRVLGLLDRVGLLNRAGHYPGELSGGERQRTAIARSLANSPDLILADEPTGNLDSGSSENIMKLLHEISKREKAAVVVVTHDRNMSQSADRLVTMVDGQIIPGGGML